MPIDFLIFYLKHQHWETQEVSSIKLLMLFHQMEFMYIEAA